MKNTEIRVAQKTGAIEFNFEELKSRLADEMKYCRRKNGKECRINARIFFIRLQVEQIFS